MSEALHPHFVLSVTYACQTSSRVTFLRFVYSSAVSVRHVSWNLQVRSLTLLAQVPRIAHSASYWCH